MSSLAASFWLDNTNGMTGNFLFRSILMSWALFMLMGLMLCTNLMRMFLIFWVSEIVSIISGRLFVETSKTLGLKLVQFFCYNYVCQPQPVTFNNLNHKRVSSMICSSLALLMATFHISRGRLANMCSNPKKKTSKRRVQRMLVKNMLKKINNVKSYNRGHQWEWHCGLILVGLPHR